MASAFQEIIAKAGSMVESIRARIKETDHKWFSQMNNEQDFSTDHKAVSIENTAARASALDISFSFSLSFSRIILYHRLIPCFFLDF